MKMSLSVNTNLLALNALNNLNTTESAQSNAMQQLSSGSKINQVADNAAGAAISQKMTAQITGMTQAESNAQDGISLIQTASGAMTQIQTIIQRMRQLALQSQNDTNNASDRSQIQQEVGQLVKEVGRISSQTQFNTKGLLNGSAHSVNIQVGANKGQIINFAVTSMTIAKLFTTSTNVSMATSANISKAISTLGQALSAVNTAQSYLGAVQNRLTDAVSNLQVGVQNLTSAKSNIMDTDMAAQTAAMTQDQVKAQAGISVLAQANQVPQMIEKLLQ
jgi:flagellin